MYVPNSAASDVYHDLRLINLWASKCRMSFNLDTNKQAGEVIFSKRKCAPNHPPRFFNDALVMRPKDKNTLELYLIENYLLLLTLKLLFPNPCKE